MIADNINHIDIYKNISEDIYAGLQFIKNASPDIELGEYKVNDKVKALVTEYETKELFERGFEAHRHVIDIQYPVRGLEKIKWSPLQGMKNHIEYNPVKDAAYFTNPSQDSSVVIGNSVFAIFFPEDAHGPQHYVTASEIIKKITMKVSI